MREYSVGSVFPLPTPANEWCSLEVIHQVPMFRCRIHCHLGIPSTDARMRLMCLGSDMPAYRKCLSSLSGMDSMSSYPTSVKPLMYIGNPNDVSQSLAFSRFPRESLVKSNSDTLQGTCRRRIKRHETRLPVLHGLIILLVR